MVGLQYMGNVKQFFSISLCTSSATKNRKSNQTFKTWQRFACKPAKLMWLLTSHFLPFGHHPSYVPSFPPIYMPGCLASSVCVTGSPFLFFNLVFQRPPSRNAEISNWGDQCTIQFEDTNWVSSWLLFALEPNLALPLQPRLCTIPSDLVRNGGFG